jgi:hypothetical protein
MGKEKEAPAPIRQSVHVDCPPDDAFRLFTEGFAEWWPLGSYSVTGDNAEHCDMEPWVGGKILERTGSGEEREWGAVTIWDPPDRVEFTWHPGATRGDDQTVTVDFRVEADGTRVTLTHRGWSRTGVATCLSGFARFVAEQMPIAA